MESNTQQPALGMNLENIGRFATVGLIEVVHQLMPICLLTYLHSVISWHVSRLLQINIKCYDLTTLCHALGELYPRI